VSKTLYLNIRKFSNSCYFCHKDERENFTYLWTKWFFPIAKWILSCFCHVVPFLPTIITFFLPPTAHVRSFGHRSAFHCSLPGYTVQCSLYFVAHILCLCLYTARSVGSSSERLLSWCHLPVTFCVLPVQIARESVSVVEQDGTSLGQWRAGIWCEGWARRCTSIGNSSCCGLAGEPTGRQPLSWVLADTPWHLSVCVRVTSMTVHGTWVCVLGPWQSMAH
jgi:hypothetical protein